MPYNRDQVLAVARRELGYHEKANNSVLDDKTANSGSGNFTKYARDLDELGFFYNGSKQGYAYCDVGVDWCFVKAYGVEAALKLLCQPRYSAGAGCYFSAMYYKQRGQFHSQNTVPQPGDQIFFSYSAGEVSHTGLVESVSGSKITCIEFNTSDMVARRYYTVGQPVIYGYGRPDWNMDGEPAPVSEPKEAAGTAVKATYTLTLTELSNGDTGSAVERVQTLLIARGYYCGGKRDRKTGNEIPDGEFGPATQNAVEDFQRASGITVDGRVGGQTMAALLK